jgi:hypothetical protein
MDRPGLMAPPNLHDHPAPAGVMRATSPEGVPQISLRTLLWSVAIVLGALEICLEAALP